MMFRGDHSGSVSIDHVLKGLVAMGGLEPPTSAL